KRIGNVRCRMKTCREHQIISYHQQLYIYFLLIGQIVRFLSILSVETPKNGFKANF
ncbi:hypothetical protein GE061_001492, partial [Apolygus lucorum]